MQDPGKVCGGEGPSAFAPTALRRGILKSGDHSAIAFVLVGSSGMPGPIVVETVAFEM